MRDMTSKKRNNKERTMIPSNSTTSNNNNNTTTTTKKQEIPLYCSSIEIGDLDDEITPISDLGNHSSFHDSEDEMSDEAIMTTVATTPQTISCRTNVPEYEINLDLSANERWKKLIEDYKDKFPALIKFLKGKRNAIVHDPNALEYECS